MGGQVPGIQRHDLAEAAQTVPRAGGGGVFGIGGRKARVDEDNLVAVGADQEADDADHAAVGVDLEEPVIEHRERYRPAPNQVFWLHAIAPHTKKEPRR